MARTNISDLNIRITASNDGLRVGVRDSTNELNRFDGRVRSTGGSLERFALKAGAAFAALRLGGKAFDFAKDFAFDGVRLAAEAEQAEVAFTTLLGSAEQAKKTLAEVSQFAASTPFRLDDIRDAAQKLAAFGVAGDDIVPTLRSIGDIAAGTGNRISDLAEIYGKAAVQGTLFAEDINQLTGRGIPIIQELAKQFGVAESEIKKLGSEGKITFANLQRAFADLTDEGGKFAGLTAEQSQSLSGQLSTLQDNVDALKKGFGEGLLPALKDGTKATSELVDEFKTLGEVAAPIATYAIEQTVGQLKVLVDVIEELKRAKAILSGRGDQQFGEDLAKGIQGMVGLGEAAKDAGPNLNDIIDKTKDLSAEGDEAAEKLKKLNDQAKKLADSLRSQYASPLEKFNEQIAKITEANQYGGLGAGIFFRAINSEVEKLTESLVELQQKMKQDIAPTARGSAADLASEFRRLNGGDINADEIRRQVRKLAQDARDNAELRLSLDRQPPNRLTDRASGDVKDGWQEIVAQHRKNHMQVMPVLRNIELSVGNIAAQDPVEVEEVTY